MHMARRTILNGHGGTLSFTMNIARMSNLQGSRLYTMNEISESTGPESINTGLQSGICMMLGPAAIHRKWSLRMMLGLG